MGKLGCYAGATMAPDGWAPLSIIITVYYYYHYYYLVHVRPIVITFSPNHHFLRSHPSFSLNCGRCFLLSLGPITHTAGKARGQENTTIKEVQLVY